MGKSPRKIDPEATFDFETLYRAYIDCRKRKRKTFQALEFEFDLERNLYKLYQDLKNNEYEIGKSICFIVTEPKPREVWAGSFRDRIVHHLIFNAIYDRFTRRFIKDTYSCLVGRGTLYGALAIKKYAQRITENYSKKAYFVKADISNFFNSIDKNVLFKLTSEHVKEPWLIDLIEKVIYHDPRENYIFKSANSLKKLLPPQKSLFNNDKFKGIPIGNLTSQFFSNIYMNKLDQYVKHELKCKYYCRYVDDFILLDKDPGYLNWAYAKINRFLENELLLKLNHRKKIINHIQNGFDFVGYVVKPHQFHLRARTVKKSLKCVEEWNALDFEEAKEKAFQFKSRFNSYLGMYKHVNGYNRRKEVCEKSKNVLIFPTEEYSKMISKSIV